MFSNYIVVYKLIIDFKLYLTCSS